jgi:hypothetical protein
MSRTGAAREGSGPFNSSRSSHSMVSRIASRNYYRVLWEKAF